MNMAESSPKGYKTLWEKEKLLIMSNFSFSYSVFKWFLLQTCKNQGLFEKGLNYLQNKTSEKFLIQGDNADYQHILSFP